MLNTSTHHFLIEPLSTLGDWWQLFPCHHSGKLNGALRIYSSPLLVHMHACWEGTLFRKLISHLKKPLTHPTQIAVGCNSWCQGKIGQMTVLWLRCLYKYNLVSWFTKPLRDKRCPNLCDRICQMLSPAHWSDVWGKKTMRRKGKSREDDCH